MKKGTVIVLIMLLCVSMALAGGLVTNTNQSAEYIRTLNRNASTCIDAAYYNPAGLIKLEDGLHFALSNWTIFQTKEMESSLATLNERSFTGDVKALIFPAIHLAYRTGNLAASGSFMPIGGGGGADYSGGLPSLEYGYAGLVGLPAGAIDQQLAPFGDITGYAVDVEFSGASVYFAGQANVAYAVSDMFSFAVGGRYLMALNTYEGSVSGVALHSSSGMDITSTYIPLFADMQLEAKQTGSGITAIVSVNVAPMAGLNVSGRYELATPLELITENDDPNALMYQDGDTTSADMPALAAFGASYMVTPQLKVEAGLNYFMNTAVDWDGEEKYVENGFDAGVAGEYAITEALAASAGFIYSKSGATEDYRNDGRLDLDATALGFGVGYKVTEGLKVNLGALLTFYQEATKDLDPLPNQLAPFETYNQSTFAFAIGVNYSL